MFKRFAIFCATALTAVAAHADFKVPSLSGPVVDLAGMLSPGDQRVIEQRIRQGYDQGIAQIQVLIMPDLGGLTTEEAAIKVFDQWKLGEAKKDNGVLFLISANEHRMRIEVGRGLEGNIPDVIAKRILADEVAPLMRQGHLAQAVDHGIELILKVAQDPDAAPQPRAHSGGDGDRHDLFVFLALLILFILMRVIRGGTTGYYGGGFGGGWGGGGGFGGGGGGWSGGGGGSAGGGASSGW